ncbi:ribosome maturation factor RimP [Microaceticoccus formicicus]|uniref:ribosome maturation factor RimP n=1 Tax=Microaceticoccus formicicus TaxID=3118105 RepID=UPI003CD0391A|nr:ribosome maturation factor RimP [Peptoniphilaceae bacterium AMB_02]
MSNLVKKLEPEIQRIVEKHNLFYVDTVFVREDGNNILRIYIDKKGGVTLDDCQNASNDISDWLDETDPIKNSYFLEVSSPGLDRPIKTDRDFERCIDEELEVNLYSPLNGSKKLVGKLLSFDKDSFKLNTGGNSEIEIKRSQASKIVKHIKIGG